MRPTRAQQKEQTRRRLVDAALAMVAGGQTLDALSLREVARNAGIAPTSFYSHFPDTAALGVALIDEACLVLRQLMRQGRREMIAEDNNFAIRQTVLRFLGYMDQNAPLLRLIVRERTGANEEFRRTIQREMRFIVDELAEDIDRVIAEQKRLPVDTRLVAEMAILVLFDFGAAALDMSRTDRDIAAERVIRKLTLVFLGGRALAGNKTL
ncbi:MAG: HTH-type transcriptional repressor FabR [Gammaproteobacteria bacterium]